MNFNKFVMIWYEFAGVEHVIFLIFTILHSTSSAGGSPLPIAQSPWHFPIWEMEYVHVNIQNEIHCFHSFPPVLSLSIFSFAWVIPVISLFISFAPYYIKVLLLLYASLECYLFYTQCRWSYANFPSAPWLYSGYLLWNQTSKRWCFHVTFRVVL